MDTIATIASRLCGRSRLDRETKDVRGSDDAVHPKPPWRRSPRTKAAFAAKAIAIKEAIGVLEGSNVAYTQPVAGNLVVDPPPGVHAALTVTFWPVRNRLQLQKRPTRRSQSLGDFERALADQGHRIAGHPYRVPKSGVFLRFERAQAERERRWVEQQIYLEEAKSAIDECIALCLQRLKDLVVGVKVGRRDPELVDARRRFKRARRRALRMS
jgi:hypothetical protein